MPSPFPGMDPYLEDRQLWPDVHASLIVALRDSLAPQIAPAYYVRIEQRTYIAPVEPRPFLARPDAAVIAASPPLPSSGGVAVMAPVAATGTTVTLPQYERAREGYLEIHDSGSRQVVTAIEVLSPTNKVSGDGRTEYEKKRREVLITATSLVEIDLLRGGRPMEMEPLPASDYRVLVSQAWERPWAALFSFGIRDPIPPVTVPLRQGEAAPLLPLGALLVEVYDRARYDLSIDYRGAPPEPPLPPEDRAWLADLLRSNSLRE